MAELIADCADIPSHVRTAAPDLPTPGTAAEWSVDDTLLAQVRDIDVYL